MTQFTSPVGRMVQGAVIMQHLTDAEDNTKKLYNEDGSPKMGVYFALAFPKKLENGQDNAEFAAFWSLMVQEAQSAWPSLFAGGKTPPRFSWKYQDGDGTDQSGNSVASKPGFAGHHIVKFTSDYPVSCYREGQFLAHQVLQKPEDVIQRGDWIRVVGDLRGNKATGTKVPGIKLYPSLISFVGQDPAGRIIGGPDAQATFGATAVGYIPGGVSQNPATVAGAAAGGVQVPAVSVPGVAVPGVAVPGVAVPGVTSTPAVAVPGVAVPGVSVPGVAIPGPAVSIPAPTPQYKVNEPWASAGVTVEAILAQGHTYDSAIAQGLIVKL